MSKEEGKLNLALPGTKSALVLLQQEPAEYVPAVQAQAASRAKAAGSSKLPGPSQSSIPGQALSGYAGGSQS